MIKFFKHLFVILFLIVFSFWLLLNSPFIQTKLKTIIQEKFYETTGQTIDIEKVSYHFPRTAILKNVSILREKDLKPIIIEKISWTVDLFALFENQITSTYHIKINDQFNIFGNLKLSKSLSLDGTTLHFSLVPIDELLNLSNQPNKLSGVVNFDGFINGSFHDLKFDLKADLEKLEYENFAIHSVNSKIQGSFSHEKINAHFSATIEDHLRTILSDVDISYSLNELDSIELKNISITTQGANLFGDLEIDKENLWPKGTLYGAIENFDIFQQSTLSPISGHAKLTAQFSNPLDKLITINIDSPKITNQDISLKNVSLTSTHKINANIHELELSLAKASFRKNSLHKLRASTIIDANSDSWVFTIQSNKNIHTFFESVGSWNFKNDQLRLTLDHLNAEFDSINLALIKESTLSISNDRFSLTPLLINGSTGKDSSFGIDIAYTDENLSGNLHLENVDITNFMEKNVSLSVQSLLPLEGILNGDIKINGPLDDQEVTFEINGSELKLVDLANPLPIAHCTLNGSLGQGIFSCLGVLTADTEIPIQFNFILPAHLSLAPFNFDLKDDAPLLGNLQVNGPLSPFLNLAGLNKISLSGNIDLKTEIYGTLNSPHIQGTCHLNDGFYEIPKIGIALYDLKGQIEIHDNRLSTTNLQGNDGERGIVTAKAFASLDSKDQFPFEVDMDLKDFVLLHQDHVFLRCEGPLVFKGNTTSAVVEGKFNLVNGRINIPERPTAVVNSVEVIYINTPEGESPPQQTISKTSDWPINLNLELGIPDNLMIKGKDLKSSWKGNIKVQGNQDLPLLHGELKINSGEYLFNGNPFEISNGLITFAGDLEKKTTLYITMTKDLDKVKVDVIAKGSINNPEISFRSNPPMPQREILSWILFNRGTNDISPFQGTQLSESITNLKTNQEGPDVLSKIKSTFGIDRFEITRNSNDEANHEVNVQVGKYIAKDVLVSVIKSDVNSLAVEAALSNRVKLQAQVGDDAQGKLILKWKRDY